MAFKLSVHPYTGLYIRITDMRACKKDGWKTDPKPEHSSMEKDGQGGMVKVTNPAEPGVPQEWFLMIDVAVYENGDDRIEGKRITHLLEYHKHKFPFDPEKDSINAASGYALLKALPEYRGATKQ